jgi:hypothetical protein
MGMPWSQGLRRTRLAGRTVKSSSCQGRPDLAEILPVNNWWRQAHNTLPESYARDRVKWEELVLKKHRNKKTEQES